ncbi:MAG: RsbRD N-terminal domain-containing protein [Armatimonadetes bacterium]|nr:RsbRD N-terminal domain-containing protein [Armatimonadota bacterium]
MDNRLAEILRSRKSEIAADWARRVHASSPHYQSRSIEEIQARSEALLDGLIAAVIEDEFEKLEAALKAIAGLRAAQGFAAGEIQHALLMGCDVVCPVIEAEFRDDARLLVWSVSRVERAINRAVELFGQAFREAQGEPQRPACPEALGLSEKRLAALVTALDYRCAAVDLQRRVTWCGNGNGASMPECMRCGALFSCTDTQKCPVARAFESGRPERGEGCEDCGVMLAVPVRDDCGAVVEVLALAPVSAQ